MKFPVESDINIQRFRQHRRRIPWGLIGKIIIAVVVLVVIYFGYKKLRERSMDTDEIQLELNE